MTPILGAVPQVLMKCKRERILMGNQTLKNKIDLDTLTYYPGFWRNERATTGNTQRGHCYEVAYLETDASCEEGIPNIYTKVEESPDPLKWIKAL